jgi:hypothetical protein
MPPIRPFNGLPGPGRPKGLKNSNTLILEEAARVARENPGEMPVDYMLRVMRSAEADDERRDNMAIAAAPFLHPRLAAIKVDQTAASQITVDMNPDQLYAQLVEILVLSGAINPKLLSKPAVQQDQGIAAGQLIDIEADDV